MPYDNITFGLAMIGYALLAADAARRFAGKRSTILTTFTVAVIVVHVLCVWAFRFEWSFGAMWTKSAFGFLLFHGAFVIILASLLSRGRTQDRLILLGFAIVSVGALPAPFRYPEIAMLRLPMIGGFLAAVLWLMLQRRAAVPKSERGS